MSLCPRLTDKGSLVLRQNLGVELVHAHRLGNSLCGSAIVAGHHHHLGNAAVVERLDGCGCFFPQGVSDAQHSSKLPADAQVQVGILRIKAVIQLLLPFGNHAVLVFKHKVSAADDNLFPLHHAGNAMRHNILHLGMVLLVVKPPHLCLLHHGVGDGMGIVLLQAGCQTEHFRCGMPTEGNNLSHLGGRVGQGAGLIKDDGIGLRHVFHKPPALDGDMILGTLPHGAEHRNGHCQLQRTGEVHHQHSQGLGHIPGNQISQCRAAQGVGHQLVRQMRGAGLSRGLELFGVLNHLHNPVIPPAAQGFLHLNDAGALLGHRAGINEASRLFGHGLGFAGHRCLVDHGLTGNHLAIQGNQAAGADDDFVAHLHLTHRGQHLSLPGLQPHIFHLQGHGARQIGNRLFMCPLLQDFTQPEHEHHGTGGIEVAPHNGNRHGGSIQHRHRQLAVEQRG